MICWPIYFSRSLQCQQTIEFCMQRNYGVVNVSSMIIEPSKWQWFLQHLSLTFLHGNRIRWEKDVALCKRVKVVMINNKHDCQIHLALDDIIIHDPISAKGNYYAPNR
jgi:hypothetical protein